MWGAVEAKPACNLVAIGDQKVDIEVEVRDRGDVSDDQILVIEAGHRLVVVRQLVIHKFAELVGAALVKVADVAAVEGLGFGHQVSPSWLGASSVTMARGQALMFPLPTPNIELTCNRACPGYQVELVVRHSFAAIYYKLLAS